MTQELLSAKVLDIEKLVLKIKVYVLFGILGAVIGGTAWWVRREAKTQADKVELINLINSKFIDMRDQRRIDSVINSAHFGAIEQTLGELERIRVPGYVNMTQHRDKPGGKITYQLSKN